MESIEQSVELIDNLQYDEEFCILMEEVCHDLEGEENTQFKLFTESIHKKVCHNYNKTSCRTQLNATYTDDLCPDCINNLNISTRKKNKNILCIHSEYITNKEGNIVKLRCYYRKSQKNDYCNNHQLYYINKLKESNGNKLCDNYDIGCVNVLHCNLLNSYCISCIIKKITKCVVPSCNMIRSDDNNYCNIHQDLYLESHPDNIPICQNPYCSNVIPLNSAYKYCKYCVEKLKTVSFIQKSKPRLYNYIYNLAKIDNIEFTLTSDDLFEIAKKECYFCYDKINNKINTIIRINPSCGYHVDNCVSCCYTCYFNKKVMKNDSFIDYCDMCKHNKLFPYAYRSKKHKLEHNLSS